jgi:HEPN domain-containing protein
MELALKGMLRAAGIEPPKWHDVGPILQAERARLPEGVRSAVDQLAGDSAWLGGEREAAFYGDVDSIPTENYDRADGERAIAAARRAVNAAGEVIDRPPPAPSAR